jgi:hypothetical protein
MLYNAKRRHIKPKGSFEIVKETTETASSFISIPKPVDVHQLSDVSSLESLSDIHALKSILVDLIKVSAILYHAVPTKPLDDPS